MTELATAGIPVSLLVAFALLYLGGYTLNIITLFGLAIGIYGLTQAVLGIPFGMLSDRFGRKPIITLGLLIFIAGSVVAAMSDTIYGVILGRALQGAGAIAAAVMALAADLTREEHRMKAMATIGATIGLSFTVATLSLAVRGQMSAPFESGSACVAIAVGGALIGAFGGLKLGEVLLQPEY